MTIGVLKPDKRINHYISLNGFKIIELEFHRPSSVSCSTILVTDDLLKSGIEIYDTFTIADYIFATLYQFIPSMIRRTSGHILFLSEGYFKAGIFEKLVMEKIRNLYNVRKIIKHSNLTPDIKRLFNVIESFISVYEPYKGLSDDIILSVYKIGNRKCVKK